jgi:4a-hydroxytetrahydrobiopterin dehydratase
MQKKAEKIVDWVALEAPLSKEEASRLVKELAGWQIVAGTLIKNFRFKSFREAVQFVDAIAAVAEEVNHHPQILLWKINNVQLSLQTYCINGLSQLDFSLASKIEKLGLTGEGKLRSNCGMAVSGSV